jgi:hypothetical protein
MPLTQSMPEPAFRRLAEGSDPSILADIYNDGVDIAIWKRALSVSLTDTVTQLISNNPSFRLSTAVTPDSAREVLYEALERFENVESVDTPMTAEGAAKSAPEHSVSDGLADDITELVGMFCMLFNVERAGVRLGVLETAMCPKFHVDRIPCRLLTTYQGVATEWLPHEQVDRSKLGHGSNGKLDHESGLFARPDAIQQLNQGDVAILKGDLWEGNEGNGLVHRSPSTENGHRLLLTMDLIH